MTEGWIAWIREVTLNLPVALTILLTEIVGWQEGQVVHSRIVALMHAVVQAAPISKGAVERKISP